MIMDDGKMLTRDDITKEGCYVYGAIAHIYNVGEAFVQLLSDNTVVISNNRAGIINGGYKGFEKGWFTDINMIGKSHQLFLHPNNKFREK